MTTDPSDIPYRLRRSARARRLRITVRPGDVEVVAPVGVADAEVQAFVARYADWVRAKRKAYRRVLEAHPGSPRLADGGRFLCRGEPVRLRVRDGRQDTRMIAAGDLEITVPATPDGAARETLVESALRLWLKGQARRDATAHAERHGPRHGLVPRGLRIKEQKNLWGSCSARGMINLNWRLIFAPPEVFEYVVVHELCHLRERHHQPPFWRLVADVIPGYEARRRWLRQNGHLLCLRPGEPG